MSAVLCVENLVKKFKSGKEVVQAVKGVSFELQEGEILGLLGPNGAGKTTVIQMLLSTLTPTKGRISYFGKDLKTQRSEVLQWVSFASSYTKLPWRLSVLENLEVYGRLYGLNKLERRDRAKKFLNYFGVWHLRHRLMAQLSAGQITRVILAKAFLAHPRVCLLDEPTASLDPDVAHEVRSFVRHQQRNYGVSILYTSHNMDEVTEVCDRVIFLKDGAMVASDTPQRLAQQGGLCRIEIVVERGLDLLDNLLLQKSISHEKKGQTRLLSVAHNEAGSLISDLGAQGIRCSDISVTRPTLEEYFLRLTKEAQ